MVSLTREIDALHIDVGSRTVTYTIIGNLNKEISNILSLEPIILIFQECLVTQIK